MRLIKRGFLIATVASASIIMASCSASAEHETDERSVRAETVEQVNLPDDGALYLKDIIWLDGLEDSYEIPTTGRYMVFSIVNGELRCINDALAIEYPDAPHSEVILL